MDNHRDRSATSHSASTGFFNGSRNATVVGSTFNIIAGDYHVTSQGAGLAGLRLLSRAISHGAMFDSAERYPAGKCHPGTREEVQGIILDWINEPLPAENIFWLHGPAGAGKSSIAQSIAEIIRETEKRYAGSFFFARGVLGRDGASALFATLAYQIATHISDVRNIVDDIVGADPTLPTKSLDVQLKDLIADPLSKSSSSFAHTPTIVIDGLDECGNSHTQRDVLRLIGKSVAEYQIPLRFLIVSRPEFWIRNAFDEDPLVQITKGFSLGDPGDVDSDIEAYLQDGFAEIYANNWDVMASVETPWPPFDVIQHLVKEASGQFIYANIVLKFVGASSDFSDPQIELDLITQPGPTRSSAFQELDNLYSAILSLYPRRESLLVVLGGLLTGSSPTAIELFLGVSSTEFNLVLRAVSALVKVQKARPSLDDPDMDKVYGNRAVDVSFCHLSLHEFLQDKSRSGPFWIDVHLIYKRLIEGFVRSIMETVDGKFQHSHVPLMQLDHMWHIFTRKTLFSIDPKIVYDQLQCLVTRFSQVQDIGHFSGFREPQYLLRYMDYLSSLVTVVENPLDFFDTDPFHLTKDAFSSLRRISASIAYKCIDRILVEAQDVDILTNMLVYILLSHSLTMDELGSMPGSNPRMAKAFIQKHWYLIKSSDIEGSDGDRIFFEMPLVLSYFQSVFQGNARTMFCAQGFLVSYRCLKLSAACRVNSRLFDNVCGIVSSFLSSQDFSDVDSKEQLDEYNVESIITFLWEYDWNRLRVSSGHYFGMAVSVANWIDRHLTNYRQANLFDEILPGFTDKLRYIMKRMYDEIFLPTMQVPLFSELCMYDAGCIRTVTLRPIWDSTSSSDSSGQIRMDEEEHWGVDVDNVYIQSYIYTRVPELDSILSRASYLQHHKIWYGNFLEFYLCTLVKGLYHRVHPEFESYSLLANATEVVMRSIHHVAYPTEKMVSALQALSYLSREPPAFPWIPPSIFCSSMIKLLQSPHEEAGGPQYDARTARNFILEGVARRDWTHRRLIRWKEVTTAMKKDRRKIVAEWSVYLFVGNAAKPWLIGV
ncbi:hypothetical protein CVT25_002131 [Psilocybe cyanescens]|uniref:Nephrocystin 3-like N-terminal domain-containing protein n=1 Tax=Psilocybe cyanescens TaxID=93625 RepID=A0A409X4M2_PSICY|nr:hypothetical protein CVT25_002131 [Psilocybe cyanescens]